MTRLTRKQHIIKLLMYRVVNKGGTLADAKQRGKYLQRFCVMELEQMLKVLT